MILTTLRVRGSTITRRRSPRHSISAWLGNGRSTHVSGSGSPTTTCSRTTTERRVEPVIHGVRIPGQNLQPRRRFHDGLADRPGYRAARPRASVCTMQRSGLGKRALEVSSAAAISGTAKRLVIMSSSG